MNLIPNTPHKNSMLKEIGLHTIDELFADIPQKIRIQNLNLPKGISQQSIEQHLRKTREKNKTCYTMPCFIGGGIKPHYVPPVVKHILSRGEFTTAYTPYLAEASQGFLQAMFEYQSMIAELTGMDIANASLYDGMTALGEAALMCSRITKKKSFVIPQNISWEKKSIVHNYTKGQGIKIIELPYDKKTGKIQLKQLRKILDETVSGVYVENPNFFGVFEDDVEAINRIVHDMGLLFVVGVDPLSLGVVRNPGDYGADIVIGEGRALGNMMDFGGSSLGLFACKHEFLRQLPGRVIGVTQDRNGKRAFCMTLQTREQHIRRGRATSNICTNEGLCALAAVVFLGWLGSNGLVKLGRINLERGKQLSDAITALDGFDQMFHGSHFNEFVIRCPGDTNKINKQLLKSGVHGGLALERWYPELKRCMLFGVSEMHSDKDINRLLSGLKEIK
jgi:glycine dehydrogenase subunit 1